MTDPRTFWAIFILCWGAFALSVLLTIAETYVRKGR